MGKVCTIKTDLAQNGYRPCPICPRRWPIFTAPPSPAHKQKRPAWLRGVWSGKRDSNSLHSILLCINPLVEKECLSTNNADTKKTKIIQFNKLKIKYLRVFCFWLGSRNTAIFRGRGFKSHTPTHGFIGLTLSSFATRPTPIASRLYPVILRLGEVA